MDGAGGIPSTDFSPGADSVSRGQLQGNAATTGATMFLPVLHTGFMDAWCGSLQSTTNSGDSGTTGNSRRESRTNDGVMAVLSLTHMCKLQWPVSYYHHRVWCILASPPLGQLSVGMPSTLSTVSSQPSPTLPQHQQHQITSASSNLCRYVLVRGSRPGQERAGEGHIHTAVTRTVVNLVPLQGAQSPVVGA
ncbi:unnamed protein product [Sphagnum jensenii]|uniref:Uncharacterized protein n=1 Tax=Sphagnum jensenii TaxID=128206 RepID=A0ABP1BCL1_9BRYO